MAVLDEVWMRKRLVDARLGDCIAIVSLDSKVHRIRSSAALLTLELKVVIVQLASEGRDLAVSKVPRQDGGAEGLQVPQLDHGPLLVERDTMVVVLAAEHVCY